MDHPTRRLDGSVYTPPTHYPRCGGQVQVFPTATGQTPGSPVWVFNPNERISFWTEREQKAVVHAHVCLDCGLTELYTVHPRQLLGEHE